MRATVAALYRHPVKSLGEEPLEAVTLGAGRAMPWDRTWAVVHGGAEWAPDADGWAGSKTFVRQTLLPRLAQVGVRYDEGSGLLTLTHPDRPEVSLAPDTEEGAAALAAWVAPLAEPMQPGPYRLVRREEGGLTDLPDAHVAINSLASLRALEAEAGAALAHIRFRGNVWVDGLEAWEEFDLLGRRLRLGGALLEVTERIERCNATAASPETGTRDVEVPRHLHTRWGHRDFGVYAQVIEGGRVALGDALVPA